MWFVTNSIDSHSIELELVMLLYKHYFADTVPYGLEIIFKTFLTFNVLFCLQTFIRYFAENSEDVPKI